MFSRRSGLALVAVPKSNTELMLVMQPYHFVLVNYVNYEYYTLRKSSRNYQYAPNRATITTGSPLSMCWFGRPQSKVCV